MHIYQGENIMFNNMNRKKSSDLTKICNLWWFILKLHFARLNPKIKLNKIHIHIKK